MRNSPVRLPALFQAGAVLQRNCALPVWGWGPAASRVRVSLAGHSANGWCSAWGEFLVVLPAMDAGGPHILRVEVPGHPDVAALEVMDLWIGEVWLASGQSNMEWPLRECGERGAEAAASANYPLLRMFRVGQRAELAPQRDVTGTWCVATPENAPEFSAVGFYFARRLVRELGIPVGVVVSAWGGTGIESWLPRGVHATSGFLREKLRQYEGRAHSDERWDARTANGRAYPGDPGVSKIATRWRAKGFADADWPEMDLPSSWQKAGHGQSGVFWFRRTLTLPDAWIGRELILEPGAIDKQDITFVNGAEVGRTGTGFEQEHWNRPRAYRIPAALVTDAQLVLAVRVYSFVYDGGMLGPADQMRLSCPGDPALKILPLAGPWKFQIEQDFGFVFTGDDAGHLCPRSPGILYENMIAPLVPFALRGVLWYQGERNTDHPAEYPEHLRRMIAAWRAAWELGDFPFLIVQLPGYGIPAEYCRDSSWALLRQGQLGLLDGVPGTGLAVTIDCGDAEDIHPANKEPVGERLAQWALAQTYALPLVKCGPLARRAVVIEGGRVRVNFDCVGGGLTTSDGVAPGGIVLLDDDGAAHRATGSIEHDGLCVEADDCPKPVAVAYAWADFPIGANLVNAEGLPASPFLCQVSRLSTP